MESSEHSVMLQKHVKMRFLSIEPLEKNIYGINVVLVKKITVIFFNAEDIIAKTHMKQFFKYSTRK